MNALVLVRRDAPSGRLTDDARTALDVMWKLQMKTGPEAGAWTWLNFRMEPWESPNSAFFGASLAALAVGTAPAHYASSPEIQERVTALRGYFARQHGIVSLLNQLMGLWASSQLPGLLAEPQRQSTIASVRARQHEDGGWSTAELGAYTRSDGSDSDTRSDGYATALASLAMQAAGVSSTDPQVAKGLAWLGRNQDRDTGRWVAVSPNKQRDPSSDPGKFMSDAATAYAVLALTYQREGTNRQIP
jgi:squalene-hopene/tetraprenyl-beta-curcumene cyclase